MHKRKTTTVSFISCSSAPRLRTCPSSSMEDAMSGPKKKDPQTSRDIHVRGFVERPVEKSKLFTRVIT